MGGGWFGWGAKPPETLENFYITANEIYVNFIIFFYFFPTFPLIFPLCLYFRKISGGGLSPQAPCLRACEGLLFTLQYLRSLRPVLAYKS